MGSPLIFQTNSTGMAVGWLIAVTSGTLVGTTAEVSDGAVAAGAGPVVAGAGVEVLLQAAMRLTSSKHDHHVLRFIGVLLVVW